MNFFVNILCFTLVLVETYQTANEQLLITKTGVEKVSPYSVGLVLYVDVNNTSLDQDFEAEFNADRCCLKQTRGEDCGLLQVVGDCVKLLPKGQISTLKLVVPTLEPFERHGYCTGFLDTRLARSKRSIMRSSVRIPFDTRLTRFMKNNELPPNVKKCRHTDENPLNDCKPVNCDSFYNGKKPFYNHTSKRCTEVPECLSGSYEIPEAIYNPRTNRCVKDPVTIEDLEYLKQITRGKIRVGKDIVIIKKFRDEPLNITDVIEVGDEHRFRGLDQSKMFTGKVKKESGFFNNMSFYFKRCVSSMTLLIVVIISQCVCLCTLFIYMAKRCFFKKKNVVLENTYFTMHDASVTTPLIGMATLETETTCHFQSDSSNVDKRIQCYKACQKDNAKQSLSDDILSKCINRRNWDTKYPKSEAVDYKDKGRPENDKQSNYKTLYVTAKKNSVNFESDSRTSDRKSKKSKGHSPKKLFSAKKVGKDSGDSEIAFLEKEIKCHSYGGDNYSKSMNSFNKKSETTETVEKDINCHSYNYMEDPPMTSKSSSSYSERSRRKEREPLRSGVSKHGDGDANVALGQASAQASFTNDSIDDFLSERGLMFLSGESMTKYSLSGASSVSSKTSKNTNIMKNLLTYFRNGRYYGTSSDCCRRRPESLNLELIHMSRATMYSSSNNDSNQKRKDSRTSL